MCQVTEWMSREKLPLVALVNNAGVFENAPVEFLELDAARWVFEVKKRCCARVHLHLPSFPCPLLAFSFDDRHHMALGER